MKHSTHTIQRTKKGGFTLVELMVTITMMLIITSISMFNYGEFNSVTITNSLAYDIGLAIRQAQQYGVSVRNAGTTSDTDFNSSYGIHFAQDSLTGFQLFVDRDGSGAYSGTSEALQTYTLQQGSTIREVAIENDIQSKTALTAGGYVDIMFKRPNPDTLISYRLSGSSGSTPITFDTNTTVTIVVATASGALTKTIVLYPTGQISIPQ